MRATASAPGPVAVSARRRTSSPSAYPVRYSSPVSSSRAPDPAARRAAAASAARLSAVVSGTPPGPWYSAMRNDGMGHLFTGVVGG